MPKIRKVHLTKIVTPKWSHPIEVFFERMVNVTFHCFLCLRNDDVSKTQIAKSPRTHHLFEKYKEYSYSKKKKNVINWTLLHRLIQHTHELIRIFMPKKITLPFCLDTIS